uniref:Uncharacterized protein n=1 Tax=Glossina morsitans morsitans TaxID=37546 RepID=A0A1B0FJT0_GLOMM
MKSLCAVKMCIARYLITQQQTTIKTEALRNFFNVSLAQQFLIKNWIQDRYEMKFLEKLCPVSHIYDMQKLYSRRKRRQKMLTTSWVYFVAITVALASMTTVDAEECGQEEFAKCAEPLEMLHLTSEFSIGAAKKEELDKLCHELRKGVRCIQSYTRRCMDFQQRNQFNKLYYGTNQFIRDLCNKGEFQDGKFCRSVARL